MKLDAKRFIELSIFILLVSYFKRRYYDLRQGWTVLAPLFAYSNFVLIIYNFTNLKEIVSQEIFVILFSVGAGLILLLMGKTFRKKQLSVDLSLAYERNKAAAKTLRIHLETSKRILEKMNEPVSIELEERIEYLRSIESGKI